MCLMENLTTFYATVQDRRTIVAWVVARLSISGIEVHLFIGQGALLQDYERTGESIIRAISEQIVVTV